MFIADVVEFLAGIAVLRWLCRRGRQRSDQALLLKQSRLKMMETDLLLRQSSLNLKEKALSLKSSKPRDPLEAVVVADALNREKRAKAALKAVLEHDGCPPEAIDQVLNQVDGAEDGDGNFDFRDIR